MATFGHFYAFNRRGLQFFGFKFHNYKENILYIYISVSFALKSKKLGSNVMFQYGFLDIFNFLISLNKKWNSEA